MGGVGEGRWRGTWQGELVGEVGLQHRGYPVTVCCDGAGAGKGRVTGEARRVGAAGSGRQGAIGRDIATAEEKSYVTGRSQIKK